jgi:polyvinyl alcohol dehydrogenase (cytochrome)
MYLGKYNDGMNWLLAAVFLLGTSLAVAQGGSESTGTRLFNDHCASCHGNPQVERAPSPVSLKQMVPEHIYEVITTGAMQSMAADLTDQQKRDIAEYLGGRKLDSKDVGAAKNMPNVCSSSPSIHSMDGPSWNGWGVDNANSRFQSAKGAGLSAGQVSRLKLKWAFGFPNATAMYMENVVDGNLFVSSNAGYLYSLDARTGCVHWSFKPQSTVRSGVVIAPLKAAPSKYAAFFGDIHGKIYAIDASTGSEIWKVSVDPDPLVRITMPLKFYEGRLYVPVASLEEPESGSANHVC